MLKGIVIAVALALICLANSDVRADSPSEASHSRWTQSLLPLHDEGWENIAVAADSFVIYISNRPVVRDGDAAVVSVRSEWMDPQEQPPSRIGKFLSLISRIEVNCTTHTYRHVAETEYAGNNLTGEVSTADLPELKNWTNLFPEPVAQQIVMAACSRVGATSAAPSK
jgi:hypothetical protein